MTQALSIGLAILSSVIAALGQLGLKFGSMKLEKNIAALMRNYALLIGLFLYGVSSITFIIALRGSELTVLYPIAALNYIWVDLLAIRYLKEKMNRNKWFGIILIIVGVSMVV